MLRSFFNAKRELIFLHFMSSCFFCGHVLGAGRFSPGYLRAARFLYCTLSSRGLGNCFTFVPA